MSSPITIANIVMEMRGLVKPGETLNHTYELLNGLADRIEAAQKVEVGNGAKIYEALKQILALAKAKGLVEIQSIAETALAEPPRNCDRFGTDNAEASLAYEEFCDRAEVDESVNGAISWLLSLNAD